MSKWKQTVVLLFFLGGLCLFIYGKDKSEQTVAEIGKITEVEETPGIEEKGSDNTDEQTYETKESAGDVADVEVHDEKYYIAALEDIAGDSTMANEMLYQLQKPYSFLLHVTPPTGGLAYDEYSFRNIVEDDLEEVKAHDTVYRGYGSAYIADCVLDKYIREYGGEDTLYHYKMVTEQEGAEELYGIYFMEIYNGDVKLYVVWNIYTYGVVSVLIEGDENAQPYMRQFVTYARYSAVDYKDQHYHHEKGTYWTLVNPEVTRNERCYRNINPEDVASGNSGIENNVLLCDVADLVLDKYIRDWTGSDSVYHVEGNMGEDGCYSIKLTSGEEMLQVSYQPDSWLVSVDVVNGPEE